MAKTFKTVAQVTPSSKAESPASAKPAIPRWMWGAVAGGVLFALYNLWDAERERAAIADLHKQVVQQVQVQQEEQHQLALAHREALILTSPQSMTVLMAAKKRDLPALEARWHPALGIVVIGEQLPPTASNRVLQLWLIPKAAGRKPWPSLTSRPDANGKFDLLVPDPPASLGATSALLITEEPEGGSAQPTTAAIWSGAAPAK